LYISTVNIPRYTVWWRTGWNLFPRNKKKNR